MKKKILIFVVTYKASFRLLDVYNQSLNEQNKLQKMELFENQDDNYQKEILGEKPRFAVEAGIINGWEKYIDKDNFIGMNSFGKSGQYKEVFNYFGITSDKICKKIKLKLKK